MNTGDTWHALASIARAAQALADAREAVARAAKENYDFLDAYNAAQTDLEKLAALFAGKFDNG